MSIGTVPREVLRAFAEMLSYPRGEVAATARACMAELTVRVPEAAGLLEAFVAFIAQMPRGALEELYTATFDLGGAGAPYVGYHLFGESYKRSVFLVRLKEHYRACGIDLGSELPDHVAALLGLAAASADAEFVDELITDALAPALDRMLGKPPTGAAGEDGGALGADAASQDDGAPDDGDQPGASAPSDEPAGSQVYRGVLRALRLVLSEPLASGAGACAAHPAGAAGQSLTR